MMSRAIATTAIFAQVNQKINQRGLNPLRKWRKKMKTVKIGDWVAVAGYHGDRYPNFQRRLSLRRGKVIDIFVKSNYWQTMMATVETESGETADIPVDRCSLADKPLNLMTNLEKIDFYTRKLSFIEERYANGLRPQGRPITTDNQRRIIERQLDMLREKIALARAGKEN